MRCIKDSRATDADRSVACQNGKSFFKLSTQRLGQTIARGGLQRFFRVAILRAVPS